jgi:hypothetical protein
VQGNKTTSGRTFPPMHNNNDVQQDLCIISNHEEKHNAKKLIEKNT